VLNNGALHYAGLTNYLAIPDFRRDGKSGLIQITTQKALSSLSLNAQLFTTFSFTLVAITDSPFMLFICCIGKFLIGLSLLARNGILLLTRGELYEFNFVLSPKNP
jgi:hypothetical protein